MKKISSRALIARINRKLRPQNERVRKTRSWNSNLGEFFVEDYNLNMIVAGHVDPESLARELRVMSALETVAR